MNLFSCCCSDEDHDVHPEIVMFDLSASLFNQDECDFLYSGYNTYSKNEHEDKDEEIMQEVITHIELFFPIHNEGYPSENNTNLELYEPKPLRKTPTIENLLESDDLSKDLCKKRSAPIPIDHTNTYL